MQLSIIIVSYNTQALTVQTIESVFQSLRGAKTLLESTDVWVVDNNSSDGSQAAIDTLTKKYSNLFLIKNKENLGFAAANNIAIERSTGKYVFLLNSDTVVQGDAIAEMVKTLESQLTNEQTAVLSRTDGKLDRLGVLAAQLYNPDDTIQAQGGSFPSLASLTTHMLFLDDIPVIGKFLPSTQHTGQNSRIHHCNLYQLDWVGGTAVMIKRETLAEVGPLDTNIFMYGEDVEFCMRAKHHHWDIAVLPSAKITHFGSASSSSKNAIIGELKGYLYIWAKHKPLWQSGLVRQIILLGVYLRSLLFGTITKDKVRAEIYKEALHVLKAL
jgi:N-acetylglucosaminyl-diphospho-decaprenol L-rhamnosyltransferase